MARVLLENEAKTGIEGIHSLEELLMDGGNYQLIHMAMDEPSEDNTSESGTQEYKCYLDLVAECRAFSFDGAYEAFREEIVRFMDDFYTDAPGKVFISELKEVIRFGTCKRVVASGWKSDGTKSVQEFIIHELGHEDEY